jgi:acylphosphatase
MDRVIVVINGCVQGVGFRWYVQRAATTLGLAGEVRNRTDGSVQIEAEGAREALERLVDTARHGPSSADVGQVDVTWSEGPARFHDFHVGRTT